MAEKPSELKENSGILTDTDKKIVSTAAPDSGEEFLDKYSESYTSTDLETRSETDTTEYVESVDTDDVAQDETAETDEIRGKIEETRRELGETIDAIQEKLSFQNISDQVKDTVSEQLTNAFETAKVTVYDATIGKAGKFMRNVGRELQKSEVGRIAADNPFPLLLIGLGVGLLAYQGFSGKKRRSYGYYENYDRDYDTADTGNRSVLKSAQTKIGDAASGAYESVSGAATTAIDSVSGAANSAYENVSNVANRAYTGVNDYAHRAYEKVGDIGTQAREQYDYYLEENPLAVGAVALAMGAAVGMTLPSTRYESQLMGEYRQNLLDKAQTAATELVDRVKEVANEAKETIKDEAKAQGLTGDTTGTSKNPNTNFGTQY